MENVWKDYLEPMLKAIVGIEIEIYEENQNLGKTKNVETF